MNWADREYFIGRGIAAVRHRQHAELQPFVRAVIEHRLPDLLAQATGSTFPNVSADQLAAVPYPEIEVDEQRAIANVLGALENKVEQNRRTARALKRLARALFRAWFVDFGPVKAKAAGDSAFSGMPPHVFDALPTQFVESSIGPVPQGWQVRALDDVADFLNGLALQNHPAREDGNDLPVVKITQLRKGSVEGADACNSDIDEKYKIKDGDLLFSWSGTLEAAFWYGGPGGLNQHLFKVTSADYPQWFLSEWIHQHLPAFRLIAASKATTMGHIKRGHLSRAMVSVPSPEFLAASHHAISPLFEMYAATQIESRKLAEMRKYLLPRLMSGEVRAKVEHG